MLCDAARSALLAAGTQIDETVITSYSIHYTKLYDAADRGLAVEVRRLDYQRSRRQTYNVRSGDSLWKIARRFGVSEKNLRVWNRLGWDNP